MPEYVREAILEIIDSAERKAVNKYKSEICMKLLELEAVGDVNGMVTVKLYDVIQTIKGIKDGE